MKPGVLPLGRTARPIQLVARPGGGGMREAQATVRGVESTEAAVLDSYSAAAIKSVELIASDVDGTLLNSQQELAPQVVEAIEKAADAGVPIVLATGKARGPWVPKVLPRLPVPMPGVFLQGLLVCDADGTVLHEQALEEDLALQCIEFSKRHGLTITAYCGSRILCPATNEHTDRLLFYEEPTPEGVGSLEDWVGKIKIHKMIMLEKQERIVQIRPLAEAELGGRLALTTALPGMLEVLPFGTSKGAGLAWLLAHLGVDAGRVMAVGDGENDVEMLQLAGLGIAMGNAGERTKRVADHIVSTNDEHGVAEAIHRFVLDSNSR
ncbi:unnamed protein product [Ostreobium quekettii]|uniref:Uncharacterized protein n=1 Tax=Ostreobium quekettii TaxID=121088 RepID=A0A8S1IN37_9CHLO|nr:unnamed protein product [Ostreobium quekettii]|eukprot:evm.model.scf_511.3 EVM.evm.TU.scf_511.3   scf_511:65155-70535(+)